MKRVLAEYKMTQVEKTAILQFPTLKESVMRESLILACAGCLSDRKVRLVSFSNQPETEIIGQSEGYA